MIAVRICDENPFAVAASPKYLERHGTPQIPEELIKHACIRSRHANGALVSWRFTKKRRMFEVEVDGPLTANEPGIAVAAAIDGAGLVQLPLAYLAPALASGKLIAVLAHCARTPLDAFYIYYPNRRQMRTTLKALVDFLRDAYRRARQTAALS